MEKEIKTESTLKEITKFEYEEKKYSLVEPSAAVVREAKRRRGIKFVEAVKLDMFTKKQLQDLLTERSPEFFIDFNVTRNDVLKNIGETEDLLDTIEDPEQLESLSHILIIYRAQLVEQEQMLREMFESTIEASADAEKNSYLVYAMLRDEEGNAVSESYEGFLEEVSFEFFDSCKYRLLCWEHNLDPSWQEALPEAKAVIRAQNIRLEEEKKKKKVKEEKEKEKEKKKTPPTKKTAPKTRSRSKTKSKAKPKTSRKPRKVKSKSTNVVKKEGS